MTDREALAETRTLLRRLLEEQTIAERELNAQRIALGLPKKPFVSDELRDAVAKLEAAEAEERTQAMTRSEEEQAARAPLETKRTSDAHEKRAKQQRRAGQ